MKVLVFGGLGFIGSHIVEEFRGNDVYAFDNLSAGLMENVSKTVKVIKGDITNKEEVFEAVKGKDIVVSTAAQVSTFTSVEYPYLDFNVNAYGAFNVIEAVRQNADNALFIQTSSRSIYGDMSKVGGWVSGMKENGEIGFGKSTEFMDEGKGYSPTSPYSLHKCYGELLTQMYHDVYGLKTVILQPSNVYGTRMPTKGLYGFIGRWIGYALSDQAIPIWGAGSQIRDYCFVKDIAEAYKLVIDNPNKAIGNRYLLASGRGTTLLELADMIFRIVNKPKKLEFYPAKKGDIQSFVGYSGRIKRDLGWYAKTSLSKGLTLTAKWVEQHLENYREMNLK